MFKKSYPDFTSEPCLSSILSIRFNFGVPLEDIFPPNDIHPRLKYLFKKAFEACIPYEFNIKHVLRYNEGTLKEKLQLKDKLVSALDYRIATEDCSPGSYFWVLRHFLGLLPLPLCPKYTEGSQFEWASLAEECKNLLRYRDENQKGFLDYDIAQNINMLPIENVIMLGILILFLRKLAAKKTRFKRKKKYDREALKALCEYFSSCMFIRPFRPGGFQKCEYKPLLLYLILRWQHISRHCHNIGHPTHFSESELINHLKLPNKKFGTQTTLLSNAFFKPEVVTICKNIPYLVNFCNKYLKDNFSQTEVDLCGDSNVSLKKYHSKVGKNAYKLAYIKEELDEVDDSPKSSENENDMYETAREFAFTSILDQEREEHWSDVVKCTEATVKRIEGSFIYDDYDTFEEEDFNQVAYSSFKDYMPKSSRPKLPSPNNQIPQSSTPKRTFSDLFSRISENSYVKFPDVCTSDEEPTECSSEEELHVENYEAKPTNFRREEGEEKNRDLEEIKVLDQSKTKNSVGQNLFGDNSPVSAEGESSIQSLQDKTKTKKTQQYVLNRLRTSLNYLRTLTPKKSSFQMIESKIKYRRITGGFGKRSANK